MEKTLLIMCVAAVIFILLMKMCNMSFRKNIYAGLYVGIYAVIFIVLPIILKLASSSYNKAIIFFTNERIIAMFCIFLLGFICTLLCEELEPMNLYMSSHIRKFTFILALIGSALILIGFFCGIALIMLSTVSESFGFKDTVLLCFFTPILILILTLEEIPKQSYVTKDGKNMKAIINGKKYNTETAEILHQERRWLGFLGSETVFKKKSGEIFIYYKPPFFNLFGDKECIKPLNNEECKKYAEAHFTADDYEKLFGCVEE